MRGRGNNLDYKSINPAIDSMNMPKNIFFFISLT